MLNSRFRISSYTQQEYFNGKHRFEHWYRDNTVYFITARTRDGIPAFLEPGASEVFWDRFNHYCQKYGFIPWATSLLSNHYHTIGYLKIGQNLGPLMQHLHGSISKLINDFIEARIDYRHVPFFRTAGNKDYFDGCIRDEKQATRAYRYILRQSAHHRIKNVFNAQNTRMNIELPRALKRARELNVYLKDVPYARYDHL